VLQTVDHFEISCLGAPFSWLEKPRNRMGRDLNCMADVLMGFHRSTFSNPNTEFNSDIRYRQHGPPKRWRPSSTLYGTEFMKTEFSEAGFSFGQHINIYINIYTRNSIKSLDLFIYLMHYKEYKSFQDQNALNQFTSEFFISFIINMVIGSIWESLSNSKLNASVFTFIFKVNCVHTFVRNAAKKRFFLGHYK